MVSSTKSSNVSLINKQLNGSIFDEFLCDRYTHQINIINQFKLEDSGLAEKNISSNYLECSVFTCLKPLLTGYYNFFYLINYVSVA